MLTRSAIARRWMAGVALLLAIWLTAQVGAVLAAPDSMAAQPELAQALPTPTPFRFLTPTPFVPSGTTSTTTTTARPPNAGGFPMELVSRSWQVVWRPSAVARWFSGVRAPADWRRRALGVGLIAIGITAVGLASWAVLRRMGDARSVRRLARSGGPAASG